MGRFSYNDADNYGTGGGSTSYFSLKNDGDVANVRVMYNGMDDVVGYAVHEVEIDDKRRYVNCLRSYNEPKSVCPLCASGSMQKAKLYIPLYDVNEGEVKVWERGKNFFPRLSAMCARYSKADVPLVSHTFDIERHGKPRDTSTTYEFYETGSDNTRLEDLPEVPEVLGTIILDKSAEDMEYFLANGSFPSGNSRQNQDSYDDRPVGRRTPASRGDRF